MGEQRFKKKLKIKHQEPKSKPISASESPEQPKSQAQTPTKPQLPESQPSESQPPAVEPVEQPLQEEKQTKQIPDSIKANLEKIIEEKHKDPEKIILKKFNVKFNITDRCISSFYIENSDSLYFNWGSVKCEMSRILKKAGEEKRKLNVDGGILRFEEHEFSYFGESLANYRKIKKT